MSRLARANVVTEGSTEEAFVREVLQEPLARRSVWLTPRSVRTGRSRGIVYRGGLSSYTKARSDIVRWLRDDPSAHVTTMFDLYRLPDDFPGFRATAATRDPHRRAAEIERRFAEDIGSDRFIPYVQLYEFEGLLFSDVRAIDAALMPYHRSMLRPLEEIRAAFGGPEEIDDGEETAPSKRLLSLYPVYDKALHGPAIAGRIGLATIRSQCPHFNAWLTRLEGLSG